MKTIDSSLSISHDENSEVASPNSNISPLEKSYHYKVLTNLENRINSMLYTYKTEGALQKAEIKKMHMELKRPHALPDPITSKSFYKHRNTNIRDSTDKKELQRLQSENLSLVQKLNKKKAEIAAQKKQHEILQREYMEKCNEPSMDIKQSNSKLMQEVSFLRSELSKKSKEVSELYLENKLLKNNNEKTEGWRKSMYTILELGAKEYDYLRGMKFQMQSSEELFDQTNRLVEYLISEKRTLEEKYVKLLELHNHLIEKDGSYSVEYIYKIKDENEAIKKDLELIYSKKL